MKSLYDFFSDFFETVIPAIGISVQQRYGPVDVLEIEKFPYFTYKQISLVPGHSLDGIDGLSEARVQFDIYGLNFDQVVGIDRTLAGDKDTPGLDGFMGTANGVIVQYAMKVDTQDVQEDSDIGEARGPYHRIVDYSIWFEE